MDTGKQVHQFPGFTVDELRERATAIRNGGRTTSDRIMLMIAMEDEIDRREAKQ